MSRALDFQIRYGNADELDNYDPMGGVYDNQAFIGGTQYLVFSKPSYDTTTRQTILNDEIGTAASGRIIISDRCIKGDGASTLNIKDTLTGTVTAKGYVTTSGTGGWSYSDITLVSGVLTLASGTWYKGIERYVNGVLYDRIPFEDVASGSDVTSFYTTKGDTIDLTPDTISSIIPTSRTDIPWASAWGDRYGYGDDLAFDFDPNSTLLTQYADSPTKKIARIDWTTSSGVRTNYIGGHQTDGAGNLITDPDGFGQKWVTISGTQYYNAYRDYSDPNVSTVLGNQELGISQDFLAGDIILKIDKKSGGNFFTVGWQDDSVYLNFVALTTAYYGASIVSNIGSIAQLFNALNGGVDTGGACPNGADDDYPNTTLGINTGAGFSVNATATQMRSLLEQSFRSATAGNFLDALVTDGYNASTIANWRNTLTRVYDGSIALSSGYNDITLTTTTLLATAGLGSYNNTFWRNYERIFQKYQSILFRMSTTSGAHWYRYEQLSIDEVSLIPASEDDKTVNAKNGNPLTFRGKFQFNAFRLDNKAAYFDTHSALIPASGTISGFAIDETWGSATFAMSGNAIACTASGSCNGIKLDNGNWYTFSEGIFGNASNYIYDVSGSGINLQISGQTAADTWQQATGQTDLGYDWRNLYGGHRYRAGSSDPTLDIFVPHVVNTQDVPTESLLPSGYTLLTDITAGKYVYNNSTWLLASGQVSEYRSELDAHEMNVTAFTESYGHYIRNQSNRWNRIVIYPNNLSEAANTLVDFNANDIESIVGITYKVTDIHDLNQINASYSKKFRLPATQRNNDLFDYVYDPNSSDFASLKEPKDCEIISNGIEILRGKGQVEATYKKDIATGYDMTVIGDNYNVYTALSDIMVSGLDLGTFTINKGNIETSWNYTAASGNVVFAPIDWGNKNYNSFDASDITPSFFIKNILQKGFAAAGIGYESEWLDSAYASRLVMPFNGFWTLSDSDYATINTSCYFLAEESSISITASGANTKQYLDITETTSNPNYTDSGARYLSATGSKSKYTFSFEGLNFTDSRITGARTFAVGEVTIGIEMNGTDVVEKTVRSSAFSISTSNIITDVGATVRPYIKSDYNFDMTNVTFKSDVSRDIAEEQTITLNQYTPIYEDGLSVFDVLKGLADAFNFIAYYDPYSRLLKFEPYGSFYSGELDWSEKWNQTRDVKNFYLGNKLNREIQHKYKNDNTDYWLERYDKGNEKREPYGSYLLELPRNYTKGRKVVENHLFAPTIDYEFSQFGVTIPNIRWNTKDGTQFSGGRAGQIPTNRLLYYVGKNASGTFKMNSGGGFQYSVESYSYFPQLAFRAVSGDSWQSLAMDSYDGKDGLFRNNFEPKYRNIWSGITSIYWLNLNERDIALRPLDKKIYLDGAWWLINQIIDFNPLSDDPTQVELIKLVNYTFDINPTTSPWIDIVTGKKFDPVSHKPNNDLPSNGGFDVTATSGYNISPIDDDYYGTSQGQNNLAPNKANSTLFGHDLTTYWSDQFIVGQFNSPNQNDVFQVGGGTSASGRSNAFAIRASGGEMVAIVEDDGRVIDDRWHLTTSGVKRSSYKVFTGSGTMAGDGTLDIYPTFDATSSGIAIFNEITFVSVIVLDLSGTHTGNADVCVSALSVSGVSFKSHSSQPYVIMYKIEGN